MKYETFEENVDKSIKPCDTLLGLYKDLNENYFRNYYNLIPFCIALGWKHSKRVQHNSAKSDGVKLSILFQNVPQFRYLYYGIAMDSSLKLKGLSNEVDAQDEKIKLAQEYLNGGLTVLNKSLSNETHISKESIRAVIMSEIMGQEDSSILDEIFDI